MYLAKEYMNYGKKKKLAAGGKLAGQQIDYNALAAGVTGAVDTIDQGNKYGRQSYRLSCS